MYLHTTTTCTCTRNVTHKCTLQKHPSVQYTMITPAHSNNLRWWTPCMVHTVPAHANNLR